jgi:hypothetical protein
MLTNILIVYLYILIGLVSIFLEKALFREYIGILVFITLKMIFNYRKCTISYIEYRLRNVPRDKGYLYSFLDGIINVRDTLHVYIIYPIIVFILFCHYR